MFFNIFRFFIISQIKWLKPEEKSEFGGGWFWFTWICLPSRNLSPQSKIRGDAPVREYSGFLANFAFVNFEILNKDHKKHPIPKTHNLCAPSFVLSPKRSSALYLLSEIIRRSPRPGNGDLLHCRRLPRSGPSQHISWTSAHADFVSKARRPTHLLPSNSRVNSVRPPSVRAAATGQGHQGRRSPPRRSASPYLTSDPAPRPGPPFSR